MLAKLFEKDPPEPDIILQEPVPEDGTAAPKVTVVSPHKELSTPPKSVPASDETEQLLPVVKLQVPVREL